MRTDSAGWSIEGQERHAVEGRPADAQGLQAAALVRAAVGRFDGRELETELVEKRPVDQRRVRRSGVDEESVRTALAEEHVDRRAAAPCLHRDRDVAALGLQGRSLGVDRRGLGEGGEGKGQHDGERRQGGARRLGPGRWEVAMQVHSWAPLESPSRAPDRAGGVAEAVDVGLRVSKRGARRIPEDSPRRGSGLRIGLLISRAPGGASATLRLPDDSIARAGVRVA